MIQREYSIIIVLGSTCQTSYQLFRKKLRMHSSPYDWLICPLKSTINLLENQFSNFMEWGNLKVVGTYENKNFIVTDTLYNVTSYHDFSLSPDGKIKKEDYIAFREKIDRRIKRFFNQVETIEPILFVINGDKSGLDKYIQLLNILKELRGNLPFHVLACGYFVPNVKEGEIDNITFYRFRKIEKRSEQDQWKGNDEEWDNCLKNIKLKESKILPEY